MNGIKYLLDTNIIIGMYEHSPTVFDLLQNKEVTIAECAFSNITRMELLGFPEITDLEAQAITNLLTKMQCLSINLTIENTTINLKQLHRIKLPDAIILATALDHQLDLLTLDKKLANKIKTI